MRLLWTLYKFAARCGKRRLFWRSLPMLVRSGYKLWRLDRKIAKAYEQLSSVRIRPASDCARILVHANSELLPDRKHADRKYSN